MKLTRIEKILLLLDFAKELAQNFWQKIYGNKILKASACLVVFALVTFAVVVSYNPPQANSLPSCGSLAAADQQPGVNCLINCSAVADGIVPNPGVNCLYFGRPLCNTIAAPTAPQHRVNCADLIDLPLCSDIVIGSGVTVRPGKNCVDLCSSPAYDNPLPIDHPEWVRSVDYAIFNRDCIRFCDQVEDGVIAQPGINCAERKCHQLIADSTPNGGVNCNMLPCNLLTPDELNKAKFDDSTKKYCEGGDLKCYQFTSSQLPYMKLRTVNATCKMHNCKPSTPSCGANEVLNITNQDAVDPSYSAIYSKYIYGGFDLASTAFCVKLDCKPVVKSQYRCTSQMAVGQTNSVHALGTLGSIKGDNTDVYRNPNCDSSGEGSVCGTLVNAVDNNPIHDTLNPITNYCYKTVDCNLPANGQASECLVATNLASDTGGNDYDPFTSWFYRPKPMNKAVDGSGLILPMQPELCYTTGQMKDRRWGFHFVIDLGIFGSIDLGWFQSSWVDLRSPGACGTNHDGDRGTGYIYMCGTDGLLYNKPSQDAVYFKGYAKTDFSGATTKHRVTVCTRFKNTLSLDTCGKRECGINEWFSDFTSQACGGDVCRELVIDEADETACAMSSHVSGSSPDGCSASFDTYLRVRAVKYNDKICAFLDSKGQLAYNNMFFDGTESISFSENDEINPGTVCVNDANGINGDCHGYSSNSSEGVADKWRALLRVHYVDDNRPAGTPTAYQGYLDRDGKLYRKQACPKVTLKLPPPDLYNIGTINNSEKLFTPPVSIRNATKTRGGDDAIIPAGQVYGKTDYHFPEIKVLYGSQVYKMSLGFGYTGYEDVDHAEVCTGQDNACKASPSSLTLSTNFNGKTYEARLFVRKEFFPLGANIPQFCLYRKIKDQNGLEATPLFIGCVERNAPDINNAKDRLADPSLPVRRAVIYPDPANEYNNAKINLRLLDAGPNKIDNNCSGDDYCTTQLSIANLDYTTPTCVQGDIKNGIDIERQKICVQREECSAIYIDCIQNEVDLNNAKNNNQNQSSFLAKRKQCNEGLVPKCSAKKGALSNGADIFNPLPLGANVDPNAYGWFNEICIVSGFQPKLKKVIAHIVGNGILGKCFIDQTSPYLTDGNPATNCDDGGRAPNCLCAIAPKDYVTNLGEEVRLQTPREAGLCVDMPLPTFCPLIDYNPNPNVDIRDLEYINSSLGKTAYNDATGVYHTHRDRSAGVVSGYAEFPRSLPGMLDVRGECKGFWTYDKNSSGVSQIPTQSCLNSRGTAAWDNTNITNPCIRFSCPAITTSGPDINGAYQASYGILENGEAKGTSNGFAVWNKFTKTNDFLETTAASACIPGFKPAGSTAVVNAAGVITSYSGGTLPTRQCDQLGNWVLPVNACVRLTCPATNLADPQSAAEVSLWTKWYANGGAAFPAVNASRSAIRIQAGSSVNGVCNTRIGFYQIGATPPSRGCDYLGNWMPVKNQCATSCDKVITDIDGSSINNGFAKWDLSLSPIFDKLQTGSFAGCVSGYVTNPYPSIYDDDGNPLPAATANDLSRDPTSPRRACRSFSNADLSVWGAVKDGCINQCPGSDTDARIGVGITTHTKASGTININWPATNLGEYAYITNWTGLESQFNASYFNATSLAPRTNGWYLLRRFCNANGKWSDPVVMCSANDGQIANAKYFVANTPSGYKNSIPADGATSVTGTCANPATYWIANRGAGPAPKKQCIYPAGNTAIDKVYLSFADNTTDCVKQTCPNFPGWGSNGGPKIDAVNNNAGLTDSRFTPGTGVIVGYCANKYGATFATWGGYVGYATRPGGSPPTATCGADLTWTTHDYGGCLKDCSDPNKCDIGLWQDCGWNAGSLGMTVGAYPDVSGIVHGASAVRLHDGLKITLYKGDNYTGEARTLTADHGCFRDFGFNDQVNSIIIEGNW